MKTNCSSSPSLDHDSATQNLCGHQTAPDEHHCPIFEVSAFLSSTIRFLRREIHVRTISRQIWAARLQGKEWTRPRMTDKGYPKKPFHNVFQDTSHPKLFLESQPLGSGHMTQYNTPNATQSSLKNTSPEKKSRLLLQAPIVHPRSTRILDVDRNVLPNDAEFHTYPRVDSRVCSPHQRDWYRVTGTQRNKNAATTKHAAANHNIIHISLPLNATANRTPPQQKPN